MKIKTDIKKKSYKASIRNDCHNFQIYRQINNKKIKKMRIKILRLMNYGFLNALW